MACNRAIDRITADELRRLSETLHPVLDAVLVTVLRHLRNPAKIQLEWRDPSVYMDHEGFY
jgi:hypothetical protein